jgi:hypothetical protein
VPHARPAEGRRAPERTAEDVEPLPIRGTGAPVRLWAALGVAVVGAGLTIVGPGLGLVRDQPAAGYHAMPLLVALAALAPLVAAVALVLGRQSVAAGVLIGSALVAPGQAVADLQLVKDALLASRPELMVPTSLAPLHATVGVWVLAGGHLLVGLAGLLAISGPAEPDESTDSVAPRAQRLRRFQLAWFFGCALIAAFAIVQFAPYRSHNAFLLATSVVDSGALARIGGLLVAAGVLVGGVLAASASRPAVAVGLGIGVAGLLVPPIVAGFAVPWLDVAAWPIVALVAIAALVVAVYVLPMIIATGPVDDAEQEVRAPAESGFTRTAGIVAVIAGLAAVIGGLGNLLAVDDDLDRPASFANRQLVPAGILIVLLAAFLLVRKWSGGVRPALAVSLTSILLVGMQALDAAFTATAISPLIHAGLGVVFTGIAMFLAVVAVVCAVIAGGLERDDVDLSDIAEPGHNLGVLIPASAAILLSIGAFGLPEIRAPGFVAPGIWSDVRLASWGLLLALLVVIMVGVLAPRSRPARAAAMLFGAAAVVGVRLLEFPLTKARADGAVAGQGVWVGLACLVALVIAAVAALVNGRRSA